MENIREKTIARDFSATRYTVYTAVFVCLGVLIPFITSHAFALKGNVFLPMHIPVLLCGFFCGGKKGFLCGLITPAISSFLTDMPIVYPMLPIMIAELSMYGLISGYLYKSGLKSIPSLIIAMVAGRICYGIMFYILLINNPALALGPSPIIASMPVISALILGFPGMLIQIVLIPIIVRFLFARLNKRQ